VSGPPAIRARDLRKRFRLYHDAITGPLKELLFFWQRERYFEDFIAVNDVSFEIQHGEVVGLIGPNGSGKTTLLKMIAGLLAPNGGELEVEGKVTALLAQGVGIHPEFSGRENILYGGMLLGMSKAEVQQKLPQIIEFAEIGDFIDRPIRTYSSGMRARLLFSISMSIDPDILIVDEALATGDAYFLQKSSGRIRELCESGATIIFVSHNVRQIQNLCSRSLVLERGKLVHDGSVSEGIARYLDCVNAAAASPEQARGPQRYALVEGSGELELLDAWLEVEGERAGTVTIGRPARLCFEVRCARELSDTRPVARLFSQKSSLPYAIFPYYDGQLAVAPASEPLTLPAGESRLVFELEPLAIGDGSYAIDLHVLAEPGDDRHLAHYANVFSFRAVYGHPAGLGRGSLMELPVREIRVEGGP